MDCSALCHQMSYCQTFSYGDAEYTGDNCLLSERGGAEVSVSADLVSDPGWAVYSLSHSGSQRCQQSGGEESGGNGGRCFREERAGVVYYNDVVRDVRTAGDLQQCSQLCHQAPYCRSFTFK